MSSNSFDAIPAELKEFKQWILWRLEDVGAAKPSKVPFSTFGNPASVTNSNDWTTYDNVVQCYNMGGYSGIGFVFTEFDPFAFIDLDDTEGNQVDLERQLRTAKEFDSYSEISPSGKGLHIIVKGSIPAGRRRSHIEIYSSGRYATMTGQVYNKKEIKEYHALLNSLYEQMGGGVPQTFSYTGNDKERYTDEEVIRTAEDAANGDKFRSLYSGEWQSIYPSQSEADFALIDIIAYYTQNKGQITRIFSKSQLGRRDKANRKDYIERMINRSFDRMLPPLDFDGWKISIDKALNGAQLALPLGVSVNGKPAPFEGVNVGSNPSAPTNNGSVAQLVEPTAHNRSGIGSNPVASTTILPPPGLIGEIAQFIYQAAPRPVPEIAIAGAMGFMAGICGRAYNISGTGLNLYILLLAKTGTGKEAMAYGIDKLINAIQLSVPVASEFVGPSEIQSGQALIKNLAENSSYVSILGEFGLRLRAMSSDKANGAEIALRRMLLDLYNKSGFGQVVRPTIYSDKAKNIAAIASPAFSILGESTPERFYEILNEEMIAEGLLPRFMLIEYEGNRPDFNENATNMQPSIALIDKIAQLMANAKTILANRKVINIETSPEAAKMLKDFDKLADSKINSTNDEVILQLWNRAHIKALKISGLLAVGQNIFNPIVQANDVQWALNIINHDIKALSGKFERGEVGKTSSELQQIAQVKRILKEFVTMKPEKLKSYQISELLYNNRMIPVAFIQRRLMNNKSFKDDRLGAATAISKIIKILVETDFIAEVQRSKCIELGVRQKLYMITNMSMLEENN